MKIHLYHNLPKSNDQPLTEIIRKISELGLSNRERLIGGKLVFLETCSTDGDRLSMDFTYRRTTNGPGHSVTGKETIDFELEEQAGFGEQTAILYDQEHEYIAMQYNHYGPRAGAIAAYLESFSKTPLYWDPVIDDDVSAKLTNSVIQSKLRLKVAANTLTEAMCRENVAFSAVQNLRDKTDAGMVDITISLGRDKRGGPLKGIIDFVDRLKKNADSLTNLEVSVKEDQNAATEILDMLKHRLCIEVEDKLLKKTQGLRYNFDSRVFYLGKALDQWKQQLS